MSKYEDLSDVLADMSQGKLPEREDEGERVNPDDPQGEKDDQAPDQGDPTAEDKDDEEPESPKPDSSEGDPEDKGEKPPEGDPAKPKDDAAEGKDKKEDKDEEPTFEIDGQKVTLSKLREWRDNGMMRADHTRKTQELATTRKQFLEQQRARETLANDIAKDQGLQKFLSARPEAIANLMANPEETRKLLGNPKAVQDFWADYDAIKKNPRLAEKVARRDVPETEVQQELRRAQEYDTMVTIVGTLEQFIGAVAEQAYPDLGPEAVEEVMGFVAGLAGVPDNPTHEQQWDGASKLFNMFYRQQEDGQWTIDHRLIQSRFEDIKERSSTSKGQPQPKEEPTPKEVQEHNARVDRQLKDNERPPKTPGGQPPGTEGEKPKRYESFQELFNDLREGI